jgi:hypothetical protein
LCCKLLSIPELDKPRLAWCAKCDPRKGCKQHTLRPQSCRTFFCSYLLNGSLGEEWKPSTCRLIVTQENDTGRVLIHVDPARPDAWRREPYYATIKSWGAALTAQRQQLIVWLGDEAIIILPDKEKNLGTVQPGQSIAVKRLSTPAGFAWDAEVIESKTPGLNPVGET